MRLYFLDFYRKYKNDTHKRIDRGILSVCLLHTHTHTHTQTRIEYQYNQFLI